MIYCIHHYLEEKINEIIALNCQLEIIFILYDKKTNEIYSHNIFSHNINLNNMKYKINFFRSLNVKYFVDIHYQATLKDQPTKYKQKSHHIIF
jgi:hypothetical protein